jgi:hypothetical protein
MWRPDRASDEGHLSTVVGVSARGKRGQRRPKSNGCVVHPNVKLWSQNGHSNQGRNREGNRGHAANAGNPRVAQPLLSHDLVALQQEYTGKRQTNDRYNPTIEAIRPQGHSRRTLPPRIEIASRQMRRTPHNTGHSATQELGCRERRYEVAFEAQVVNSARMTEVDPQKVS